MMVKIVTLCAMIFTISSVHCAALETVQSEDEEGCLIEYEFGGNKIEFLFAPKISAQQCEWVAQHFMLSGALINPVRLQRVKKIIISNKPSIHNEPTGRIRVTCDLVAEYEDGQRHQDTYKSVRSLDSLRSEYKGRLKNDQMRKDIIEIGLPVTAIIAYVAYLQCTIL